MIRGLLMQFIIVGITHKLSHGLVFFMTPVIMEFAGLGKMT